MRKFKYVFFLPFLFSISLTAQVNTFNRQLCYTWNGAWVCYSSISQASDRGYLVARDASDSANLWHDQYCEFFKTSREGNPLWGKRFFKGTVGNGIQTTGNPFFQTSDGGYFFGTLKYQTDYFDPQIVLIKTDSLGNNLWSGKFPGEGISKLFCAKQCADSGYIICGSTTDSLNVQSGYVFKIDATGNYQWGKKMLGTGDTLALFSAVVELPGQGFVVAGFSGNTALAIRIDQNGNMIWTKNIFSRNASFYGAILTTDNKLVFAGSFDDTINPRPVACLVKTDLSGNMIWEKALHPVSSFYTGSYAWSITELSGGSFAFSGYVADPIPTTFIGAADASGTILWCRDYHGSFHSFNYTPDALTSTQDGGFALSTLAGTYVGSAPVYSEIILKTDGAGMVGCDGINYPVVFNALNDSFSANALSTNCGSAIPYNATLTTIPILDSLICETIQDPDPSFVQEWNTSGFELSQNVPNPFTEQSVISYHLNSPAQNVSLEIYDTRGIKVSGKTELNSQPGDYSIIVDKNNFPDGIYLYVLTVDGKRLTKKMLVQ
jgi:hypothetical protein